MDVVAPTDESPAPPRKLRNPDWWVLPALLLITLIGGGLRFLSLDRPTIWGDEAATYGRIAGSDRDLLDQLTDSASIFTPLHYELYWWISQGMPYWGTTSTETVEVRRRQESGPPKLEKVTIQRFTPTKRIVEGGIEMTPRMMRLVPAIAGTLMIPAIYFLSRQMFGRRVSLLAAVLCCFSAWLLVFSRDGKMYMHFWLVCTLHLATLLWWLRVRTTTSWLCWVATGVAMVALHAIGQFLFLTTVLIVLTAPRQHWRQFFTIGALVGWIIATPFVAAYDALAQWRDFRRIAPIRPHLLWPIRVLPTFRWPPIIFFALGMVIIHSALYGEFGYYDQFNRIERVFNNRDNFDVGDAGVAWVAEYNAGRKFDDLILYATSAYLTGWEWPRDMDQKFVHVRTLKLLKGGTITILGLLAIGIIPWRRLYAGRQRAKETAGAPAPEPPPSFSHIDPHPGEALVPAPPKRFLDYVRPSTVVQRMRGVLASPRPSEDPGVYAPYVRRRPLWLGAWIVVTAFTFYAVSTSRPASVLDAISNVALYQAPQVVWPRLEKMPVEKTQEDLENEPLREKLKRLPVFYTDPARKQRFAEASSKAWSTYTAAFVKPNIAVPRLTVIGVGLFVLGVLIVWRGSVRHALRLWVAIGVIAILLCVLSLLPMFTTSSIWMPRYVGLVFPAVAIVAAALIARQPTWWLRGLTLAVFIVVNLGQFGARVYGQTEAPVDLMAADLIRSQPKAKIASQPDRSAFRAYYNYPPQFSGAPPGRASLFNSAGNYYLRILSGIKSDPKGIRRGFYIGNFRLWDASSVDQIVRNVRSSPELERFVVWTGHRRDSVELTDPIADALVGRFDRVSEQTYEAHDHWTWIHWWTFTRREYVRVSRPESAASRTADLGQ